LKQFGFFKITLLAWRLLHNCLTETTNHLFFDCSGSGKLWVDDLSWLGISCAMINNSFCRAVLGLVSQ
jgi:hypothetical protein